MHCSAPYLTQTNLGIGSQLASSLSSFSLACMSDTSARRACSQRWAFTDRREAVGVSARLLISRSDPDTRSLLHVCLEEKITPGMCFLENENQTIESDITIN